MATTQFSIGDPVWAKMKGFPPWPGKVANPPEDVKRTAHKKPMHCIFFFGTNNYAWIQEDQIKPYEAGKEQYAKPRKTTSFKEALESIEDYVRNLPEKPVRNSDLPSIKEEFSTIFPHGSVSRVANAPAEGPPAGVAMSDDDSPLTPPLKTLKTEDESTKKTPRSSKRTSSGSTSSAPAKRNKAADKSAASLTPNNSSNDSAGLNSLSNAKPKQPASPPLDVEKISDVLREKRVSPSNLKFGFLGLGNMGQGIVQNLLNSGHKVTVWNRTSSKCRNFVEAGALQGSTPADVVADCDITFCCVSDSRAAKEVVFGNCGVLHGIKANKGYVEMTSIDPETSQVISEVILLKGGRYLEARVPGFKKPAEEGTLILGAGDWSLFEDCDSCFRAIGKRMFYLGEVGKGSKMSLIVNMLLGTMLAGLEEAMALCDRAGINQSDLLKILELGDLRSVFSSQKGLAIIEGTFTSMPLQHLQNDLRLAISIGDHLEEPLPVTAAAKELFKCAKNS